MRVDIATTINVAPDAVWDAVQRPELLSHIAWPLIRFTPPRGATWPLAFEGEKPVPARLWLFGVIPLGVQWIVPSVHQPANGEWPKRLRDNGYSRLIQRWDHWISVKPDCDGGTTYRDTVDITAGVLTPLIALFAQVFYRHRQRRWRRLAIRLAVYRLIWDARADYQISRAAGDHAAAWTALQAQHILAQRFLGPHFTSHVSMLCFAFEVRDWREVGGQLLRLTLVPVGNATGRLPVGNHGRARVSPFQAMPLPQEIAAKLAATETTLPTSPVTGNG